MRNYVKSRRYKLPLVKNKVKGVDKRNLMSASIYLLYGVWSTIMVLFIGTIVSDVIKKYNRDLPLYKYIPKRFKWRRLGMA
jgi:hypothetical protein